MATAAYKNALDAAASLSHEEKLRLLQELSSLAIGEAPVKHQRSILELQGLGKEIWEGIDVKEYINAERDSWNG